MMPDRENVLQQALALPAADRAFVVAALEQSLTPQNEHAPNAVDFDGAHVLSGADFLKELERRSAMFRDGSTSARSADEVLADLRRRQEGEAAV